MLELDLLTVSNPVSVALDLIGLDMWYWSCDQIANQHKRLPGVFHKRGSDGEQQQLTVSFSSVVRA